MDNFWNFRPTDEQMKAAYIARQQAGMQGYAPAPDMQGYRPTFGGRQVDPGFIPATQPQLQQAMANAPQLQQRDLMAEYEQNNKRIAEIEQELKNIGSGIDELDLKLAENRANAGDIGNAYLHLSRLDSRQAAARNRTDAATKEQNALADEIDRLYVSMAGADPVQQEQFKNYIARKEAEYEKLYGKKYDGNFTVPTGRAGSGVTTYTGWDDLLQQELVKNGNNGRLSKAQVEKLQKELDNLPQGENKNSRQQKLDNILTNEKKADSDRKQKAKETEAVGEAMASDSGYGLDTNGSRTYTAKNGVGVTITRLSGGKIRYKAGNTSKER